MVHDVQFDDNEGVLVVTAGVLEVTAGKVPLRRHLGEGVEAENRMEEDMAEDRMAEDRAEDRMAEDMDRVGVGDAW